jgi:hypothetical protein
MDAKNSTHIERFNLDLGKIKMALTSVKRCEEKKVYTSSDEAIKTLSVARLTARSPESLVVYRCNNCRKFHLGNNKALVAA